MPKRNKPTSDDEFEVESIKECRIYNDETWYKIGWKGWTDDDDTWEPEENVNKTAELSKQMAAAKERAEQEGVLNDPPPVKGLKKAKASTTSKASKASTTAKASSSTAIVPKQDVPEPSRKRARGANGSAIQGAASSASSKVKAGFADAHPVKVRNFHTDPEDRTDKSKWRWKIVMSDDRVIEVPHEEARVTYSDLMLDWFEGRLSFGDSKKKKEDQ